MKQAESKRRILPMANLPMQPYDFDGVVQPEMSYARLSYDPASQRGSYLIRMQPGSATIPHVHGCREEYLILEGEAIEDDGTVLKPGDWIVYEAGTRHNTRTETGCLLVGIDWDAGHPRTGD